MFGEHCLWSLWSDPDGKHSRRFIWQKQLFTVTNNFNLLNNKEDHNAKTRQNKTKQKHKKQNPEKLSCWGHRRNETVGQLRDDSQFLSISFSFSLTAGSDRGGFYLWDAYLSNFLGTLGHYGKNLVNSIRNGLEKAFQIWQMNVCIYESKHFRSIVKLRDWCQFYCLLQK